jgi:hypothetical protein
MRRRLIMADEKTEEQKAAEAKAAEEAAKAAEEKAAEARAAEETRVRRPSTEEEDLSKVDTSKYSHEETIKFVAKLQDENARRRIANKKSEEEKAELESKHSALEGKHADLNKRLEALEKEKKEKSDAEKTEIEQMRGQLDEMQTSLDGYKADIKAKEAEINERDSKLSVQDREIMVDRLLASKGAQFSSEFERAGFMAKLTKMNGGKFELNDEEVIYEVTSFAKESKTNEPPPKTPPAGPPGKTGEVDYATEIKELASKPFLTPEDKKRLDELSELSSQAAELEETAKNPRLS